MNFQVEAPEKKKKRKRKTKSKNSSPCPSPPSSSYPSFSSLPDEIAVNCLARISRSYYPTLSIVSKSFRSLVASSELYAARSHLGSTEKCVYVCLLNFSDPQWFRLWINPNRTLPNSMIKKKKKKKKTIGQLLVPIPSSNLTYLSTAEPVAVGSELYVIGGPLNDEPSSAVRVLDCRSDTWREAPSMNVARKYAVSCVYDGKIYVFGGVEEEGGEPWGEVFDTKTQTWERLPDPGTTEVRKRTVWGITEMEGKIYYASLSRYYTYAYDTEQCKWEYECGKDLIAKAEKLPSPEHVRQYSSNRYLSCSVYDVEDGHWKEVNGLESLEDKFRRNGGSSGHTAQVVSCGGKLFVIWEGVTRTNSYNTKIWCAGIVLEKRHGGDMWGTIEWVDVVHTVPRDSHLSHCHALSV